MQSAGTLLHITYVKLGILLRYLIIWQTVSYKATHKGETETPDKLLDLVSSPRTLGHKFNSPFLPGIISSLDLESRINNLIQLNSSTDDILQRDDAVESAPL